MIKLTKEQIKQILRKMEKDGSSFIKVDVENVSYNHGRSWETKQLIYEYSEDGNCLGQCRIKS